MGKEKADSFTIIPAPVGTKGIFEMDDDSGDVLEVEDVVFLIVWHDGLAEHGSSTSSPTGCSMFGTRAAATIHPDGRVMTDDVIYKDLADFMLQCDHITKLRNDSYKPLLNASTGEPVKWHT